MSGQFTKRRRIYRIITTVYLLAVAYLCFASSSGLPSIKEWHFFIPADKVVHFLMFFPFPILAYLSFGKGDNVRVQCGDCFLQYFLQAVRLPALQS